MNGILMTINASHTNLVLLPLISATIIAVAGVITPLVRRQPQQLSTHSANQGQILCTITLKKCHVRIRKYLDSQNRLITCIQQEGEPGHVISSVVYQYSAGAHFLQEGPMYMDKKIG